MGVGGIIGGLGAVTLGLGALLLGEDDAHAATPTPKTPKPATPGGGGGAGPAASMTCAQALAMLPAELQGTVATALASGTKASDLYTLAETLDTFATVAPSPDVAKAVRKSAECIRVRAKTIETSGSAPIFAVDELGDISEFDVDDNYDDGSFDAPDDGVRPAGASNPQKTLTGGEGGGYEGADGAQSR